MHFIISSLADGVIADLGIGGWIGLLLPAVGGLLCFGAVAKGCESGEAGYFFLALLILIGTVLGVYHFFPTIEEWNWWVVGFTGVAILSFLLSAAGVYEDEEGCGIVFFIAVICLFIMMSWIGGLLSWPAIVSCDKQKEQLSLEGKLSTTQKQIKLLSSRVKDDIPDFSKKLHDQAKEVRNLYKKESNRKDELREELEEIARFILALEKLESQCSITLVELASVERRLQRYVDSEKHLGGVYIDFMEKVEQVSQKAHALIGMKLKAHAGSDVISEIEVDSKVFDLLR